MKIVIPGGSGQVGTVLARDFHKHGDEVVIVSRHSQSHGPWKTVIWDAASPGDWVKELEGADVVINLAGRSVNCRYNVSNREAIMQSRLVTTRLLGEAIAATKRPPSLWLQASTATIYAHRYDAPNDEATGIIGGNEPNAPDTWRFSIDVATSWEREFDQAVTPTTRKVKMRTAMVMSPDIDGIFDTMLTIVRRGLGGTAGDGSQFISWIHDADFIRAIRWIFEHENIVGAINLASPNPLPNKTFMRDLRQAWGAPIGLPATKWMLELGAILMKTETELVLKSRRVIPGILVEQGFEFDFPEWPEAARDLCKRWRQLNADS